MKIAIRADGGSIIGMGHIIRTLVLAQELSKNNEVFYVCKADTDDNKYRHGIEKIRSNGFSIVTVSEKAVIEDLKNVHADCLITDSYDVNEEYFNSTKKIFKYTGYIDDNNLHYFNVDFIINQNIHAKELNYITKPDTKLFLGTEYVMLREEFRDITVKEVKRKVKDVLITVGGADPNNLTGEILNMLNKLECTFHIVVGPSFNNVEVIKNIAKSNENIKLHFNPNMCELMGKCDLAISACGSTLYELCACGIPTIGIVIVDNQKNIAEYMGKLGLIYNLGWYDEPQFKNLSRVFSELVDDYDSRLCMSKKQLKVVNRNGVKLLVELINRYFSS